MSQGMQTGRDDRAIEAAARLAAAYLRSVDQVDPVLQSITLQVFRDFWFTYGSSIAPNLRSRGAGEPRSGGPDPYIGLAMATALASADYVSAAGLNRVPPTFAGARAWYAEHLADAPEQLWSFYRQVENLPPSIAGQRLESLAFEAIEGLQPGSDPDLPWVLPEEPVTAIAPRGAKKSFWPLAVGGLAVAALGGVLVWRIWGGR